MNLGKTIQTLRKEKGLTQNELAEKLFVSYQAVSQWENGNTNPDVSIIPNIADTFEISIDELFGRKTKKEVNSTLNVKEYDDNTLYIVLAKGKNLKGVLNYKEVLRNMEDVEVKLDGDCLDVQSHFSLNIDGDVKGDAVAGDGINCGNVGGSVSAGDGINCGNIEGSVSAGDGINCGNINGSVSAGDSINCGNIIGSVSSGDSINCCDIEGSVSAGDSIQCKVINGNVDAEEVTCETITAEYVKAETINLEKSVNFKR